MRAVLAEEFGLRSVVVINEENILICLRRIAALKKRGAAAPK